MIGRRFLATPNYTSCNEDWETELRALEIRPMDRVLCITGSGDRPLNLLIADPARIVALDLNPRQTELLRLKSAAMTSMAYDEYGEFLGLHEPTRPIEPLAARLPPELRREWRAFDGEPILYAGRWERYYRRTGRLARWLHDTTIRDLFAARDLERQREVVDLLWDRRSWRSTFDLFCHPAVFRLLLGDPAFFAHVDPRLPIGRYLCDGMRASLDRRLARRNSILALVFWGKLSPYDLPPHLAPEHFESIRSRLSRIEAKTADLLEFLETTSERFTRFSLSDVASYLSAASFDRLLEAMIRAAEPEARFCLRQFLTGHSVSSRFRTRLRREPGLEEELRRDDRAFAYRFIVGSITPA